MYFFTADEHLGHANIIKYTQRPFDTVHDMNMEITRRHNEVVGPKDTVVHVGDFTLQSPAQAITHIKRLNGRHIFVPGSHDRWINTRWIGQGIPPGIGVPISISSHILELTIEKQHITCCHYAMRVWPRSHYNTWLAYGHSHGKLPPQGKSWDVGVDNNNFYPVSFDQLKEIMEQQPDNFNLVQKRTKLKENLQEPLRSYQKTGKAASDQPHKQTLQKDR